MAPPSIELNPLRALDNVYTGRVVLMCHSSPRNQIEAPVNNFWLALVCSDDLTPANLLGAPPNPYRDSRGTFYPVWLIGKTKFLWMMLSQMFYVYESHADAFAGTPDYNNFSSYYQLACGQKTDKLCLEFFEDDVKSAKGMTESELARGGTGAKRKREVVGGSSESEDHIFVSEERGNDDSEKSSEDENSISLFPPRIDTI